MLQQTALMLIAGLIFLFFFVPGQGEARAVNPVLAILLLAAFTLMPGLLSYFFGRRAIKRLASDRDRRIRQLQNSRRYTLFFGVVVLAGFVIEVYCLQLPLLVNRAFAFLKFENIRMLMSITPLVIAILLTRLAIFELDRQVRNTSWTRRKFLALNLKLMIFPLSPFIICLAIGDIIDHSPISVKILFIAHSYIYWVIMLAIVVSIYLKAPFFIRRIWATRPLPAGEIRDRIEFLARRENIKYRDVLVWDTTGGNIANAGMAGLLPGSRYIFLTDSLLSNFTVDEIETVVAHEFGHIKYGHMLAYLAFSLGYLVLYVLLYIRLLPVMEKLHLGTISIAFLGAAATLLAFFTYFVFIFRLLSRRFERQADLYAVDSTGKPEVFRSALLRLAAVNYTPRRVPRLIELVHTHPSVFRRLELVSKFVRGDADAVKYRRPIFHTGRVLVLVLLALSLLFAANRDALLPPGEVHYEMGRQYLKEGMNDKAIMEFREAARADPQSQYAHFALGIAYARKGMTDEAIAEFKEAARVDPQNEQVHYTLAITYAGEGIMEEAVKELEKTLEINPRNTAAREKLEQIRITIESNP